MQQPNVYESFSDFLKNHPQIMQAIKQEGVHVINNESVSHLSKKEISEEEINMIKNINPSTPKMTKGKLVSNESVSLLSKKELQEKIKNSQEINKIIIDPSMTKSKM